MGIFVDRSNLPSADPSTVWLADLIEATEVVAASAKPCDPVIVKAFRHRLETRADVFPNRVRATKPDHVRFPNLHHAQTP
jgi:hypothetical protein